MTPRARELQPDLVALTTDLVDGNAEPIGDDITPFGELAAPHGIFFVTGNHDHLSRIDPWLERVSGLCLRVLRHECVAIGSPDAGFDLLWVDEYRSK